MKNCNNRKSLAVDVHRLTASNKKQVCCICGREYEGYGNNPSPYENKGRCCDKCDRDYVIPARMYLMRLGSNLTDKEVKKEMTKFRKRYLVFPYNFREKYVLEIGKRIISGVSLEGFFQVTHIKTDTIIEGMTIPIGTMSKSEAIECMEKYLSTIGETLESWTKKTGYNLYWDRALFAVAKQEWLENMGCSISETAFVEPLIDKDADTIERMAESPNVDVTESVTST